MRIARYLLIVIAVAIVFVLILLGLWFDSCNAQRTQKKKDAISANIIAANVEIKSLENTKTNINGELTNANKNSVNMLNAINAKRDSANFNSNFNDSVFEWCKQIKFQDSECERFAR